MNIYTTLLALVLAVGFSSAFVETAIAMSPSVEERLAKEEAEEADEAGEAGEAGEMVRAE